MKLLCFFLGMIVGGTFGTVLTAVLVAAGDADRREELRHEPNEND